MSTAQATPIGTPAADPAPVEVPDGPGGSPYLFTTEDFDRMIEAEVFPIEARVELWDGRIYEKMAKLQPHVVSGNKLNLALFLALPPGWFPGGENSITLGQDKVPLPDMVVFRGRPDDYNERRAGVADIGLVVELAWSSLKSDLGTRLAAYAEAGIPAYWVVNLVDGSIHVHATPVPAERRYASVVIHKPGESIPLILDGVEVARIAASEILPAR